MDAADRNPAVVQVVGSSYAALIRLAWVLTRPLFPFTLITRKQDKPMDELDPISMFELCFPGAVTGKAEVNCPHCDALLTMEVDDPMGTYSLECVLCGGEFDFDMANRTVEWDMG